MKDFYHTIQSPAIDEQNIQRSRFIGYCYPVASAEEALECVSELRKEHYSATHVCWAYSIYGNEEYETRSNDDGEPSGTAGKPILGRLLSRDLTNVVVAVVRYFGGVKLGTSGLIDAYHRTSPRQGNSQRGYPIWSCHAQLPDGSDGTRNAPC